MLPTKLLWSGFPLSVMNAGLVIVSESSWLVHAMALPLPELPAAATPRLRPWGERDVAVLLAAGHDPVISRYRYSLPSTPEAAHEWIVSTETDRDHGTRLELAIKDTATPVGSISLTDLEHGNAMVRYWLLPEGRGRGLATTALRLLARWGFATLALGRLAAFVELDNTASRAVLERAGFLCEGRLRQHMTDHAGNRVDTFLYSLLPADLDD
ncbi:MAG: GNAT family protein [Solirubrobacteraceae bacterium]